MKYSRLIFSIFLVMATAAAFVYLFAGCLEYERACQNPIQVKAVVTDHCEDDSSESGLTYDSLVTYQLEGAVYENVLFENGGGSISELTPLGTEVLVNVNPEDHGQLVEHIMYPGLAYVWSLPFTAALAWLLQNLRRLRLTRECKGIPEEEIIVRDLKISVGSRYMRVLFLLHALMPLLYYLRFPMLFPQGYLVTACIFGGLWLLCLCRDLRDLVCIKRENYDYRYETLIRKKEESIDDGTKFYLYFSDGEREWKKEVLGKKYRKAVVGAPIFAVYLEGTARPILYYDMEGNAVAQRAAMKRK